MRARWRFIYLVFEIIKVAVNIPNLRFLYHVL